MKVVILTIVACLGLAASAAAFPHHNKGVSPANIDQLINDGLTYYLNEFKKAEAKPARLETIPIKTDSLDLTVDISNVKQEFGNLLSKSESSSLTDSTLSISTSFSVGKITMTGDVAVKGTIKGNPVDVKSGNAKIVWDKITEMIHLNAVHDAKSVTIESLSIKFNVGEPKVELSQLEVDQAEEIKKGIQQGLVKIFKTLEESVDDQMQTTISYLNSLIKDYNLDQLYEVLRAKVPVQENHFMKPFYFLM